MSVEQKPNLEIILPEGSHNPFSVPFSEFGNFTSRERVNLNKQASAIVGAQVYGMFKNDSDLSWLLVYGPEGHIIKPRANHELPTQDAVMLRFARRVGVVPFVFIKPVSFEEIRTSGFPSFKAA